MTDTFSFSLLLFLAHIKVGNVLLSLWLINFMKKSSIVFNSTERAFSNISLEKSPQATIEKKAYQIREEDENPK
jgi:hypothetical protein